MHGEQLTSYVIEHANDEIDEELIEDYFRDSTATLQLIPIESIIEGDSDHNIRNLKKEKHYLKMNFDTMPPIVITENHNIIDGNHRFRVAKQLGFNEI